MPYMSFSFENTNQDQVFEYWDKKENNKNYPVGPVNHNDTSPSCQCWKDSDGKGRIALKGSTGPTVEYDIRGDGESIRY